MSTIKVDTIQTRTGSGNITASNNIAGNLVGDVTGNTTGTHTGNIATNSITTQSGTTITIPTGKTLVGTDTVSIKAPGMVVQVVHSTFNTQTYKASTSTGTTGHAATITPKYSNSKILISHKGTCYNEGNNLHQYRTVYRGSTNLASSGEGLTLHSAGASSMGRWSSIGFDYLDSPNTTSATTYTMHYRGNSSSSNTYYCYGANYPQVMVLYEIAQ